MTFQEPVASPKSPYYMGFKHKGKQVIDEKCSCKHLKSEHGDRFAIGHGVCSYPDCKCKQFTWVGWITEKK